MANVDYETSSESFSFSLPSMGNQDQTLPYGFGLTMPKPPTNVPQKDAPADVLFSNGRIIPHAYQSPQTKDVLADPSQLTSRNSSTSSKDSGTSSRSNSSSSRSSRSASRRKSTSGGFADSNPYNTNGVATRTVVRKVGSFGIETEQVAPNITSSPRRPGVALTSSAEMIRQRKRETILRQTTLQKEAKVQNSTSTEGGSCFGIFKSFTSACRECHALEPQVKQDAVRVNAKY